MKYTGLYDDPLHPVACHIAELCRKYNDTSNPEYLDLMQGAINMAHTFGIGVSVFRDSVQCLLLYVSVHDYDTDEVLLMSCVKDPFYHFKKCQAYMTREQHKTFKI